MQSRSLSPRAAGASARTSGVKIAVLTIAMLAGGCAASNPGPSKVAGPQLAFPGDLPPLPKQPAVAAMRVEIEDDGLPSQLAPRNRRPIPDEPTEPWSPNYGTSKASGLDARRVAAKLDGAPALSAPPPALPAPIFMAAPARPIDADDIIRRAIAEHEMRQR